MLKRIFEIYVGRTMREDWIISQAYLLCGALLTLGAVIGKSAVMAVVGVLVLGKGGIRFYRYFKMDSEDRAMLSNLDQKRIRVAPNEFADKTK